MNQLISPDLTNGWITLYLKNLSIFIAIKELLMLLELIILMCFREFMRYLLDILLKMVGNKQKVGKHRSALQAKIQKRRILLKELSTALPISYSMNKGILFSAELLAVLMAGKKVQLLIYGIRDTLIQFSLIMEAIFPSRMKNLGE